MNDPMEMDARYLTLLRRELTRSQARLKRAELERDRLRDENEQLKRLLRAHGIMEPEEGPGDTRPAEGEA